VSTKSKHNRMAQIPSGFCEGHLRYVLACSDTLITNALAALPPADLTRLRKLIVANEPLTEARKMWAGTRVVTGWLEANAKGGTKQQIATETGLSRTTVRRAIAQLDASGALDKTQTLPAVFKLANRRQDLPA
jgi:hypothetical protein